MTLFALQAEMGLRWGRFAEDCSADLRLLRRDDVDADLRDLVMPTNL